MKKEEEKNREELKQLEEIGRQYANKIKQEEEEIIEKLRQIKLKQEEESKQYAIRIKQEKEEATEKLRQKIEEENLNLARSFIEQEKFKQLEKDEILARSLVRKQYGGNYKHKYLKYKQKYLKYKHNLLQ